MKSKHKTLQELHAQNRETELSHVCREEYEEYTASDVMRKLFEAQRDAMREAFPSNLRGPWED